MMSEPVNKTIAFWYYRHQHHAPWWYDGVAAAAVSSAIPTHSSSTSPLAWTMGAVCHRRGFPFLLPHNILAYGVKIAAIVVVVAVDDVQGALLVFCNPYSGLNGVVTT